MPRLRSTSQSTDTTHLIVLFLAVGLIAFLYSSVGHAGASGYIATMTLFGLAPTVVRPTALVLNILVASIGTFQFWRAGHFSLKLFWPFALFSVPAAYVGGYLQPSASVLRILIGVVLLFSATRLVFRRSDPPQTIFPTATVIGCNDGECATSLQGSVRERSPRRVRWRSVQDQGLVFFPA